MPSPETPKEIGEIPGISEEKAQQLENDPNLSKALLVQEESGKNRLIAVLRWPRNTITTDMWDCLNGISRETKIAWTCIPQSQEEKFRSRYPKVIDLFYRKPDSKTSRHPIV